MFSVIYGLFYYNNCQYPCALFSLAVSEALTPLYATNAGVTFRFSAFVTSAPNVPQFLRIELTSRVLNPPQPTRQNMKFRSFSQLVLTSLPLLFLASTASADSLGSASSYAVLGQAGVTNAGAGTLGATVVTGDLAGSIGTPAVTGFPPGVVVGTLLTSGAPNQAFLDVAAEFNFLSGLSVDSNLSADLAGLTLSPGVYSVPAGTTNLSGVLTLDDHGVGGSLFVFLMPSTLITSSGSSIDVSKLSPNDRLFWVVGSAATLGNNTNFMGNILALDQIAFDPGATDLCGRALSKTASVTFAGQDPTSLIENQVSTSCANVVTAGGGTGGTGGTGGSANGFGGSGDSTGVPEPSVLTLLCAAGILGLLSKKLLLS
jgi:hypothetical protein